MVPTPLAPFNAFISCFFLLTMGFIVNWLLGRMASVGNKGSKPILFWGFVFRFRGHSLVKYLVLGLWLCFSSKSLSSNTTFNNETGPSTITSLWYLATTHSENNLITHLNSINKLPESHFFLFRFFPFCPNYPTRWPPTTELSYLLYCPSLNSDSHSTHPDPLNHEAAEDKDDI